MTDRYKIKVAVYLMLVAADKILLLRRANTGWKDGDYGLPAGHLEADETLIMALLRETEEEVGLKINPEDIKLVHTMHRMNSYVDFFFVCTKWDGNPENTEPEKCDDLRWCRFDMLPDNMIPSVKHAIAQYRRGILFSEFKNEEY